MLPGRIHAGSEIAPGSKVQVDACVVGSGAGGSAVALELSRKGMKVAVLEEGRSFAPADLVARPSWAFRHLYQGRGVMVGKGKVLLPLAAGRAVGGSTFINSAICFRAPRRVLEQWEREDGFAFRERLDPIFAEIEKALEVEKVAPSVARNNSLIFKRGADKLGLGGDFISRNAPGCVGCGVCQLGCPIGGKGSVDKNLLPAAIALGADVYSEVRASQISTASGAVTGVTGEILDGEEVPLGSFEVKAGRVFLCGGAFGTPQLLQKNSLCNSSGQVGENLHVHPGQAAAAVFPEEIRYWDGATQGYFVDMDDAILETFTGTPELFWAALPLGQMSLAKLRNFATAGCMVRDQGKGSIRHQGEGRLPEIKYELAEIDRLRFIRGSRQLSRIFFAAGATTVYPVMNTAIEPADTLDAALAQLPDDLPATRLNPYGSHPQGTCRMSADPRRGVCKPTGETHDLRNLYIADGSLFPTALGVNPQITILSLATAIARSAA